MATALQIDRRAKHQRIQLDPALKEFLDVVVIPALVKKYLLEHEDQNRLAVVQSSVRHCESNHSASAEAVQ